MCYRSTKRVFLHNRSPLKNDDYDDDDADDGNDVNKLPGSVIKFPPRAQCVSRTRHRRDIKDENDVEGTMCRCDRRD